MPSGDVFVAEDGGNLKLCILANTNGVDQVARFLRFIGHDASEVTGPAFSPDHTRLYVSSQRGSDGINERTYEITRHGLHEPRLWVAVGGRSIRSGEARRQPCRHRRNNRPQWRPLHKERRSKQTLTDSRFAAMPQWRPLHKERRSGNHNGTQLAATISAAMEAAP